jgi:hypothetical protein
MSGWVRELDKWAPMMNVIVYQVAWPSCATTAPAHSTPFTHLHTLGMYLGNHVHTCGRAGGQGDPVSRQEIRRKEWYFQREEEGEAGEGCQAGWLMALLVLTCACAHSCGESSGEVPRAADHLLPCLEGIGCVPLFPLHGTVPARLS